MVGIFNADHILGVISRLWEESKQIKKKLFEEQHTCWGKLSDVFQQ